MLASLPLGSVIRRFAPARVLKRPGPTFTYTFESLGRLIVSVRPTPVSSNR